MTDQMNRQSCLSAETVAAFVEGNLTRQEIAPVLAHLRWCRECMADVETLRRTAVRQPPFRALAAAAIIILVAAGAVVLRNRMESRSDPMQHLVSLAPRSARIIEPRLDGGFTWAPYRGPMRAGATSADAGRLQLAGAAGDAVVRADRNGDATAQRVAGVALLLVEQPEDAVVRLRAATERAPSSAESWSDLGAALDDLAVRRTRPSSFPEALAALDRSLALQPEHPEALFNRALVLEHIGLTNEARKAWEHYLRADASPAWAAEARNHLLRLPRTTGEMQFRDDQPRFERAALAGDTAAVDAFVTRYPQQSRTFGEAEYLGQWGEAFLRGDETAANAALAITRAIGTALGRHTSESLLRRAVESIDNAGDKRRRIMAEAHVVYRRGRIAYSKQQPSEAEPELRNAAALFASAGDPMALVARYFAACARYDRDDVAGSRADLTALLTETDPHQIALGAQIRWQLALTSIVDADWSSALATLNQAEAMFRILGERSNLGFIRGMQSMTLTCLGRPDDAWAARIDAFTILSGEGRADRLPVSLGGAARMELYAGRLETARALLRLEIATHRDAHANLHLTNALAREALLDAELGDSAGAKQSAREAQAIASAIDPALRALAVADANLAEGAASLHDDPRGARALLTRAIDFYAASQQPLFLPQAQLLRARASLRLGDRAAAMRDVDDGVAVIERHRIRFAGPVAGTDVLEAGVALGREAIRLRLDAGDVAGAFDYAERRNRQISGDGARPRVTLSELQRSLAGSDTAVLDVTLLPSELAIICVTENDVMTARVPASERLLAAHTERAAADITDSAVLYELLIRPVQPAVALVQRLIIVPDPLLQQVPYAALYDKVARRYLIENVAVSVAESASLLRAGRKTEQPRSLLTVALPSGVLASLPDVQQELAEIKALYPRSVSLDAGAATLAAVRDEAQHADVIHLSGHTLRQNGVEEPALQFAGDKGPRNVSWREVSTWHLGRAAIVVVAGCETLRRSEIPHTRGLSLGGGFLAAGAADVIGTLEPIADRDARDFFRALHRNIAAGAPAADALRRVQLDAIATETATGQRAPWRSVALLTNHIMHVSHR